MNIKRMKNIMNFGTKLKLHTFMYNIFTIKRDFHFSKICSNVFRTVYTKRNPEYWKNFYISNNVSIKNSLCTIYPVQLKKRSVKKKKVLDDSLEGYRVAAFSTCEEYDLESLLHHVPKLTSFKSTSFNKDYGTLADAIHLIKNNESEDQHIFFFKTGSVVMWNILDEEIKSLLRLLRSYESNSFSEKLVENESEFMNYFYSSDVEGTKIVNERIILPNIKNEYFEKYAISNALALSVYLGVFEANLEEYIETMEPVTEDLRTGSKIKISRNEVLKKTGELFAFRHNINLNSDLLDTPDFYWDREDLENTYLHFCNYFCINKRTKVMNEKLNHCIELVDLLSTYLNDKHHTRLEWMIIILIMVEVVFETLHYLEKLTESNIQSEKII